MNANVYENCWIIWDLDDRADKGLKKGEKYYITAAASSYFWVKGVKEGTCVYCNKRNSCWRDEAYNKDWTIYTDDLSKMDVADIYVPSVHTAEALKGNYRYHTPVENPWWVVFDGETGGSKFNYLENVEDDEEVSDEVSDAIALKDAGFSEEFILDLLRPMTE